MKSYIFFCRGCGGIGGEQLYLRNKINYLKSKGWDVKVFSYKTDPIIILDLKPYSNGINKKLCIPPFLYSYSVSEQIFNWFLNNLQESEEYVVESDSVLISYWGEMLAKRVKGKHILFLVDEKPMIPELSMNYLKYKFKRHELYCITSKTLQLIFPDINNDDLERYKLTAFCFNSIDDTNDSYINIQLGHGVKIGVFGRIDKPYVKPISLKIIEYAEKHLDLFFEIVYIGGPLSGNAKKRIYKCFKNAKNIKVNITGYICPVPRTFMDKFDFFIGSAGAALAMYMEGYLTIAIDGFNFKSNGIVGIHTTNTLSTVPVQYELEELFDEIIYKKTYKKDLLQRQSFYNLDYYFNPHMECIYNNNVEKSYFDFGLVKLSVRYCFLKNIIRFLGVNISVSLFGLARKAKVQNKKLLVNCHS